MEVYEAIKKRRSIRSFTREPIPVKILEKCVDAARLAPSSANLQPLEYVVVNEKNLLKEVFSTLKWAGYLDWNPSLKESPTGYIVVLKNREIMEKGEYDVGMAVENIVLVAMEEGIGSCILSSIDRGKLRKILKIPERINVELVVALGYANEKSIAEEMEKSIKYYRDKDGVLRVPKRKLEDIMHKNGYTKKSSQV